MRLMKLNQPTEMNGEIKSSMTIRLWAVACRDLLAVGFLGFDLLFIITIALLVGAFVVGHLDSHRFHERLGVRKKFDEGSCWFSAIWAFVAWLFIWCFLCELFFKVRIARLKGFYLQYRVRKALLKIDVLLLKHRELVRCESQSFSENSGGPVLVDQLLDSTEGVNAHNSFQANVEWWHRRGKIKFTQGRGRRLPRTAGSLFGAFL